MAQVRFLDQVPVGVYESDGGGQSVNIYYSSSLVLANVPLINFTGSVDVYQQVISGSNGVTVDISGFPYSGSAVITGSLIISSSDGGPALLVYGNSIFTGSLYVTGSVVANSFTGSLLGTASNAVSSSFAQTASFVNPLSQSVFITGSLTVTGSINATSLTGSFTGSVAAPGTTTQVVYNSGSVLGADSGFVYSGSRVGIGIATPSASLHISGSSNSILLEVDSPAANNILYISGSGNVGIGTSNPSVKLQVNGVTRFQDPGSNSAIVMTYGTGGWIQVIDTGNTEAIRLRTGGASYINTGQSFLIGTTTDSARLTVRGSGATSSTTALLVQNANASASLAVLDNGTVSIATSSYASMNYGVVPNLYVPTNTFLDGTIQLPTTLRIIATGGGINFGQQSAPSSNSNLFFGNNSSGVYYGNYLSLPVSLIVNNNPFLKVFSSGNVTIDNNGGDNGYKLDVAGTGRFTSNLTVTGSVIIDGGLFDTLSTGSLATGSTLIYSVNTGSYSAGFFDYYAISGSNGRSGTVMSFWSGSQIQYTDNSTPDVGDTSNFAFSMSLAGSNAQLFASASSNSWTVKTSFRTF
jgi:hypothetical protein